jgi:hypothetical protein
MGVRNDVLLWGKEMYRPKLQMYKKKVPRKLLSPKEEVRNILYMGLFHNEKVRVACFCQDSEMSDGALA